MHTPVTILSELPVHPSGGGDEYVMRAYLRERDEVRTRAHLEQFVARWRAVWKLPLQRGEEILYEEKVLARGKVPGKYALKHFLKMRAQQETRHRRRPGRSWQTGAHLMAPRALVEATFVSNHFGIPHDGALIQLFDGQRFF